MVKGLWVDVVGYARLTGKSISTIRRYIKANRIKHKFEKGKFYIFVPDEGTTFQRDSLETKFVQLKLENRQLRERLNKIEEERRDLEMLIQIYEKRNSPPAEIPSRQ